MPSGCHMVDVVPKNNQGVPKAEREAAVLDAASKLFTTKGYRETSIAAVGKAVGVASAAVLWYYPTKDDLFAASLHKIFIESRRRIESNRKIAGDPHAELAELLEQMLPFRGMHREAYERMADSEALREVYDEVQRWLEERLLKVIDAHAPSDVDRTLVTDVAHIFFEGMLISVRAIDRPLTEYIDMVVDAAIGVASARKTRRK